MRNDSHVFGQKCPDEQGSVTERIVMMQQPVSLFPKFQILSLHSFTEQLQNITGECGIDSCSFVEWILWNQRKLGHTLDSAFHLLHFFRPW